MSNSKVLFLLKSLDGGTGTFAESVLTISDFNFFLLSLEKPAYRKLKTKYAYFAKKSFYPKFYKLSLKGIINFFQEVFWLKKQISLKKPDLLLSADIHANFLILVNKILFYRKIPVVITIHTGFKNTILEKSSGALGFILKKIASFLYGKADEIVSVSEGVAKETKATLGLSKNPSVINNGIKVKKVFNPTPLKARRPLFLSLSRLNKQKDFPSLIRAFSKVAAKLPGAKLIIVGDGEEKSNLKKMAKKLNLSKNIVFEGWRKNSENYLKKANIFVLSSKREGLPYAMLEAISSSKAVISTNTPYGPSEILGKGKYGIVVPIGDVNKLFKSMLSLATNKERYLKYSKLAFERSKTFSKKEMLKKYKQLFLNLTE